MASIAAAFGLVEKPAPKRVLQHAAARLFDMARVETDAGQHEALTDALALVSAMETLLETPQSPFQATAMLDLMARAEERGDWLAVALAQAIAEEAGAFR